jgi:hypothetical protein
VEDDTEEAPWMVMGDAQFWAAAHLATSLHHYAQVHGRPWYVASLLPIVYRRPGERRTRQVAPDVLVAFVPQRARQSYDLAAEGGLPRVCARGSFVVQRGARRGREAAVA